MPTTKIKIRIDRENGTHYFIKRDVIKVAPGLCVHQNIPIGCNPLMKDMWTITHIGSGLALAMNLADRKTAKTLALQLAEIINWEKFSGNPERVKKDKYNRIVQLLNKYR